ncbi:MAG: hypothetical protein KAV87_56115 [Desulfobacteraceae bacterium]|nr:hypothetical protein [Desulfobacteraceae bacterium]
MNHHHHHEDIHIEGQGKLSEREKLGKLLEYWIKHNREHAKTYLEWSKKADSNSLEDVVGLLKEASEITMSINDLFEKAIKKL